MLTWIASSLTFICFTYHLCRAIPVVFAYVLLPIFDLVFAF